MMNHDFNNFGQSFSSRAARVQQTWYAVQRQPSWVVKAAVITFVLVFVVPIAVLVMIAVAAAVMVFALLAGFYMLTAKVRRWLGGHAGGGLARPRNDGRENVRVIRRDF